MNIKDCVKWIEDLDAAPDSVLLTLRLIFDEPDPAASIEQDLRDLYVYPERLTDSYRPEWRAFIKQAISRELSHEQRADEHVLSAYLQTRLHERQLWAERTYKLGVEAIEQTQKVSQAGNVSPLPNAHKQMLEKMIQ